VIHLLIPQGNLGIADISGMQGVRPGDPCFPEEVQEDNRNPTVEEDQVMDNTPFDDLPWQIVHPDYQERINNLQGKD
jgi:hypothetical protein